MYPETLEALGRYVDYLKAHFDPHPSIDSLSSYLQNPVGEPKAEDVLYLLRCEAEMANEVLMWRAVWEKPDVDELKYIGSAVTAIHHYWKWYDRYDITPEEREYFLKGKERFDTNPKGL